MTPALELPLTTAGRYGAGGGLARRTLPGPPLASFGHGAAGIAYFLSRYGALTGERRWRTAAREWWARAERDLPDPGAFVADAPLFPDARAAIPASLYFGEAGMWCVGALVAQEQQDADGIARCVERFATLAEACPVDRPDVVSGAAGLLLGAATILEALGSSTPERLAAVGERHAGRLTRLAGRVLELSGPAGWLGAAHGWGGIAHALLRWCQATDATPGPGTLALLESLHEVRLPSGQWPRHTGSDEVWPGWCHGSAGWTQLWTLVWEVLGDSDALTIAEQAALHAISAQDAGPGLCCGAGGSAYAAVALYRATGQDAWLAHARRLAAHHAWEVPGPGFPEQSLWQGQLGLALLLAELAEPSSAAMPLYRRVSACS